MYSFVPITDHKIAILDPSGQQTQYVRSQLANYKTRWKESLAANLSIHQTEADIPAGVTIIAPSFCQVASLHNPVVLIDSINQLTHYDLRAATLEINDVVITDQAEAQTYLDSITADIVACDFEAASKLTQAQKDQLILQLEQAKLGSPEAISLDQRIKSDGLSHPSLAIITHFSIATSETDSVVIVTKTEEMRQLVLNWIVQTEIKQIWHNLLFDGKHIYHHTKKLPKHLDDSMLMWATILNHTDTFKSKVGLKGLAKKVYGSWADSEIEFTLENIDDPTLIRYANIDSMATMFVYNEAIRHPDFQLLPGEQSVPISEVFPAELPNSKEAIHSRKYFYESVIKPLIPAFIHLMDQGITIDMDKVADLSIELDKVLAEVEETLNNNPLVQDFRQHQYKKAKPEYIRELESKKRSLQYYTKDFDVSKMDHRSYLMNFLALTIPFQYKPTAQLPDASLKWTAKDVKTLAELEPTNETIQAVANKTIQPNHPAAKAAMMMLATTKANLYNKDYTAKIDKVSMDIVPKFNPGSSKQLQDLFTQLNIPSFKESKTTGLPSYDRDVVSAIHENAKTPELRELTKCIIDHSFSAIIKSNFIKGFKLFTVDGSLKGNIKLFGAKSFRPTSNRINLLQLPSTGSRYAKPVKKCFVAQPGFITASSDYSALQEVTAANVTRDPNKVKVIGQGFDSHCFHAASYYPRVEEILGPDDGTLEWNKRFKKEAKTNPELGELRQISKPVSFKLMFGGMPDSHKGGSITEAIYDKFHNKLYPGIRDYNDKVVLRQAKKTGELHMGLGCYIKTNDPDKDARTLGNVAIQFYDLITLLAIPQLEERIARDNMQDHVKITATIYDAIYFEVRETPEHIKWLNDNLIEIMVAPMFKSMEVPNLANLDVGPSWAEQVELPNNATIEQIQETLEKLKE